MVKRDQIRRELQLRQPPARVLTAEAVQPQRAEGDGLMTQIRVLSDRTRSSGGVSSAGFNRRMRKTARTVVWESDGAQTPSLDPIATLQRTACATQNNNSRMRSSYYLTALILVIAA